VATAATASPGGPVGATTKAQCGSLEEAAAATRPPVNTSEGARAAAGRPEAESAAMPVEAATASTRPPRNPQHLILYAH